MNNPTLLPVPFAQNGIKNEIQVTRQPGQDLEDATLSDGFPKVTMQPIETGGLPPKGMDFNGIFYEMSDNIVFQSKGGRYKFSSAYATSVGGYPKGAVLQNNAENKEYLSLVDNNSVDFNTASEQQMAGQWVLYSSSDFSTELAKKANKGTTLASYGIADAVRVYKAGAALPQSDIGPIWHADYASLMTWVVYSANGASYAATYWPYIAMACLCSCWGGVDRDPRGVGFKCWGRGSAALDPRYHMHYSQSRAGVI